MELQADFVAFDDEDLGLDVHPADELIVLKAQNRDRQGKATGPEAETALVEAEPDKGCSQRRKRVYTMALNIRTADEEDMGNPIPPTDLETAALHAADNAAETSTSTSDIEARPRKQQRPNFQPPVGVTVIEDDEEAVQVEVKRLLRGPRYFTHKTAGLAFTQSCFKCGQLGHFTSACPTGGKKYPCSLCAQFGHADYQCPHSTVRCYKCNRLGHVIRDCKEPAIIPLVCNQCGSPDCAASGRPDWYRAEGHCTMGYKVSDMECARCYKCGRLGHLTCVAAAAPSPSESCYNCGSEDHLGPWCIYPATRGVAREKLEMSNMRGLDELRSPNGQHQQPLRHALESFRTTARRSSDPPKSTRWQYDTRDSRRGAAPRHNQPLSAFGTQSPFQAPPPVQYPAQTFMEPQRWQMAFENGPSPISNGRGMTYGLPTVEANFNFPRNRRR